MVNADYQTLILPVHKMASDGKDHVFSQAVEQVARKGVFITTSSFSKDAKEYVSLIDSKIIPIDGEHLSRLMAEQDVGVSTVGRYEVKKPDSDYFDDQECRIDGRMRNRCGSRLNPDTM